MDNNIKISIVIPVFNGEKYIVRCLDSIIGQTLENLEIIFVNDGSTDNTKFILDKLEKEYDFIKVIHQKNAGPGSARNKGIDIAKGKYIGFVDVDDLLRYDMYERLYAEAETYNLDMVVCGQKIIDGKENIKEIVLPTYNKNRYMNKYDIKEHVLKRILIKGPELLASQSNKIYRKSIIDKYNMRVPENRWFGEDWFFNQLILGKIESIGFINQPLYKYIRSNPNSLSSRYLYNAFDIFLESYTFKKERLKEWDLNTEYYERIENSNFCRTIYSRVIMNEMSKKNEISYKNKFNNIKQFIKNVEVQYAANNCNKTFYSRLFSKKRIYVIYLCVYFNEYIRPYLSLIKKKLNIKK